MKRIRKSRAARVLSWVLTVAMIAPIFLTLVAPRPALAQQAPQTAGNTLTVIVVPFGNKDHNQTGGTELAQWATDAVAVELSQSSRFEVLKPAEVTRQAQEFGFRAPYDQSQLSKIASALGATAVVSGDIAFVRTEGKKNNAQQVNVGLYIRVADASSGELINGAAKVGAAIARPGVSDVDALAREAVSKAALEGVREILTYTLPVGIVTNSVTNIGGGTTVLINRGSRDGVKNGMDMIVLRNGARVGRLRVTNVFADDAEAEVTENLQGIRPEDQVRATFPMPILDVRSGVARQAHRTSTGSTISTLGKVLLVLAIGIVIATTAKSGGSVTGVTSEADTQNAAAAVRITWRDNLFGGGTLEYHVWRQGGSDSGFNYGGIPAAAVGGGIRTYEDRPLPYDYWTGANGYLKVPTPDTTGNGGNNGGTNGGSTSTFTVVGVPNPAGTQQGFITGTTYIYQVSAVIRRAVAQTSNNQNNNQNSGTSTEDIESNPVNSGPTTPVDPPVLSAPVNGITQVNIRQFTNVAFTGVTGADNYVVELSTDRTFMNRSRILQLPIIFGQPGATIGLNAPVDLTNPSVNKPLRNDPTFANFINNVPGAPAPTIFIRVGARNSADRPGPVNWITKNPKDNDRTFRWVYSQPNSFQPAVAPPPPP